MCGTKIVLAFGVLLVAAYARPEGYGVKGVKPFRATANAAASAQAFGNTGSGHSGIARSSATASADASAGGTANAAAEATANAFADGENIGKAISSASAIANANHPIGRSDGLDRPSDRGKDIEYKATNHQDGTPTCDQHIANAGHGGFVNKENSTPGSIDSAHSATVCHPGDSKCRNSKKDHNVPSPHTTYNNKHPDLSSGSSQHNAADPESDPCAAGSHKCLESGLEVSNPNQHPPYNKPPPDLSSGSSQHNAADPESDPCAAGSHKCLESGLEGSNPNQHPHDHAKLPDVFKKSGNKDPASNPHPSYNAHPNFSEDSSLSSAAPDSDYWGGNTAKPASRPCAYGSPKCSTGHIPNPDQTYPGHVELPEKPRHESDLSNKQFTKERYPGVFAPSAQTPANINSGSAKPNIQPSSVPRGCNYGNPKCEGSENDDSNPHQPHHKHAELPAGSGRPQGVTNPQSSHNEHPDLSASSSQSSPKPDGSWGDNTANHEALPCNSGSRKCSGGRLDVPNPIQPHDKNVELTAGSGRPVTKPSVSNPYPSQNEHPDLTAGSSKPFPKPDAGWGGNTANPESRPCTPGSHKCSEGQPDVSNPDQPHDKHVDFSGGSGRPVAKPSVSNPHPSQNEHPDSTAGSSKPFPKPGAGWGGNTADPESRPCPPGSHKCSEGQPDVSNPDQLHDENVDSKRPVTKPSVSNPYPSYNKHPDLSTGSSQPLPKPDGGWGGNTANPVPRPCTSGSRECSGDQPHVPNPNQPHDKHVALPTDSGKPSVSNPHPSYNEYPNLSAGSSQPLPNLDGGYGGHKSIKPPGEKDDVKGGHRHIPFNKNPDVSTGSSYPSPNFNGGCGRNSATPGSRPCTSGSSGSEPGTSNPFLNGEIDVSEIRKAVKSGGSSPDGKPNPSNPFLNGHNQHPPTPTGSTHHWDNSNNGHPGRPSDKNPESKPNPSNPFLNNHSQHPPTTTGSTHHSGNPNNSKPNPLNPFLNSHSQHPPTPTGGTQHSGNPNNSNQGRPSDQNSESKPNPLNPFLNNHSQHPPTPTGNTQHSGNPNDSNLGRPSDQNSESKPNPLNPFLNSHSQHSPGSPHNSGIPNNSVNGQPSNQYPESESNPSNPFLKPDNQHPSSSTADIHNLENENGSDKSGPSNQYPHGRQSPSNPIPRHHERDEVEACSRGSCKHKGPNAGTDNESLDADEIGNRKTPGRPSNGVKTYRPGVKGDSARRPQSSPPIKYHASGDGDEASANANASSDAYSNAHASASADADGNAHAKSQAYSSANASGWSNSWASSSASASASASSSSWH